MSRRSVGAGGRQLERCRDELRRVAGSCLRLSIGAELDAALWTGIVLLIIGALLAALAALAITAGARRRATPSAVSADPGSTGKTPGRRRSTAAGEGPSAEATAASLSRVHDSKAKRCGSPTLGRFASAPLRIDGSSCGGGALLG